MLLLFHPGKWYNKCSSLSQMPPRGSHLSHAWANVSRVVHLPHHTLSHRWIKGIPNCGRQCSVYDEAVNQARGRRSHCTSYNCTFRMPLSSPMGLGPGICLPDPINRPALGEPGLSPIGRPCLPSMLILDCVWKCRRQT